MTRAARERAEAQPPATVEQQAALAALEHAKPAFMEAFSRHGFIGWAARQAGVSRRTVNYWLVNDPELAEFVRECRLDITDELGAKGLDELRYALTQPGMVTNHPNLYFHEMNFREPARRPNAAINIDNRSITVNHLSPEQAAAVARALTGTPDDEEPA